MPIVKTLEFGDHKVEIDEWGGVHFDYPEDHDSPLSYTPQTMKRIFEAREEVIDGRGE